MSCICTHSFRSHSEGKECTAIVGDRKCECFVYRDGDIAEKLDAFDKQTELYQLLSKMEPLTKSIQ